MQQAAHKNLVLISARQFASRLATAMLIGDAEGKLVFYNEAAEKILGRSYSEAGEMSAQEWKDMFETKRLDGSPMPLKEMPAAIAFLERRPAFGSFQIKGIDGAERVISVTGFPLFSRPDELVGFVAIFWEEQQSAAD